MERQRGTTDFKEAQVTQTITTRNNPRRTRRFSGLLAAVAMIVVQLWSATPAHASHSVTITHEPPPVAIAGSDARLVVAVDGCWIFCNRISLDTTYRIGEARTRTIRTKLGSFGPQAAVIVIPGRHVANPALSYFLEASQDLCPLFDICHTADARLPERGAYSIPVE